MADLEVTIKYNSRPAKIALTGVVLLMPIWGILAPAVVLWWLFTMVAVSGQLTRFLQHGLAEIGPILGLTLIFALGVKAVLNLADNRIVLSKLGIELPFFLGSTLGLRRTFSWATIRHVELVENRDRREIILSTTDGFPVYLNVKCMAPHELEQLLVGIDVWAVHCEKNSALETLKDELHQSATADAAPSYTEMWDEELSRRFSSTAYVPLEPGSLLRDGRLKVINQLSFGGLSAVYLCQLNQRDLVVVKEAVVPQDSDDEVEKKALELFEREARLLMRLDHASIARVLDCFVDGGRHYLTIEYHNGQDLNQFVKQHGAQSADTVLGWGIEIATILEYLHSQDPPIIHRDVTPDNLVLGIDGSLIMIDFGAANEFLGTATGTLVGKQSFIAPEQFRGKATVQSDLYALGCTLYFLLTAKEPLPLSASHPRSINESVSAEIDELVAALTHMELNGRIKSATEAKERMLELLEHDHVQVGAA